MDAVNALFGGSDDDLAEAILASLSESIFEAGPPKTASGFKRKLARPVHRHLKRITRTETGKGPDGNEVTVYRNRILERSKHPYAETLLKPSAGDSASFVEGGDPMNAPYMMLLPEIRKNAGLWDKILLDSVQGRDVQIRFALETLFAYEAAKARLDAGEPVRLKSVAAGTGLCLVLVFDRLVRAGCNPEKITAVITDRDPGNIAKARHLIERLETTKGNQGSNGSSPGISTHEEDVFHAEEGPVNDIVTVIGILEYFPGFALDSGREDKESAGPDAVQLLKTVGATVKDSGVVIANSYRLEIGARIIEIFGKEIYFRDGNMLHAVMEEAGFAPEGTKANGVVYDVEAFKKAS